MADSKNYKLGCINGKYRNLQKSLSIRYLKNSKHSDKDAFFCGLDIFLNSALKIKLWLILTHSN